MNNKALDCTALTIAIIGAINWGLIGFFSFDLVAFIFGNLSWVSARHRKECTASPKEPHHVL